MNNLKWREHPNLVANGMFKAKFKNMRENEVTEDINGVKRYSVLQFINQPTQSVRSCTLIARSIESLTDEELRNLSLPSNNRKWIGIYSLPAKDFLYLLSIGVWIGSPEGVEYETL